jgi:glutamate--cysteine ligase
MQEICEILDNGNSDKPYTQALNKQVEVIHHPELTASARILSAMRTQKMSITELVLQKSHEYTHDFRKCALDASVKRRFDLEVKASLAQQEHLDATEEIPFDQYLSNYFFQDAAASKICSQDLPRNMHDSMIETAAR